MVTQLEIKKAADIIKAGGLVAFPTETVYGLGANALDTQAVARIFESKERPSFDPLIVHIASIEDIDYLTAVRDERVRCLVQNFWPGPLTLVLPKSIIVPDIVTSGLSTVGIRMPDNHIALELIRLSGCPIAAPSANKFGRISPTNASHVKKQLKDVDYILDGGPSRVGIESTVIELLDDGFVILRQGIITKTELEQFIPYSSHEIYRKDIITAPGTLESHYSPTKPLFILGNGLKVTDTSNAAFLSFGSIPDKNYKITEYLSRNGDLYEAAANLFGKLHLLEDSSVDFIVAEPVPETGIGIAIMDRLRKAAHQYLK
ncbi:MAG: L-threonylcarbamoyladenylate synthase [Deltaproteobacteria bacterium]